MLDFEAGADLLGTDESSERREAAHEVAGNLAADLDGAGHQHQRERDGERSDGAPHRHSSTPAIDCSSPVLLYPPR